MSCGFENDSKFVHKFQKIHIVHTLVFIAQYYRWSKGLGSSHNLNQYVCQLAIPQNGLILPYSTLLV
jgi:hypothetical protein